MKVFIAVLLIRLKNWKQCKYSQIGQWLGKLGFTILAEESFLVIIMKTIQQQEKSLLCEKYVSEQGE